MQMKNNLEITNIIDLYQKKSEKRKAFEMKKAALAAEVAGTEGKENKTVFKYKYNVGYSNAVIRKVKMSFFTPKMPKVKI